VRKNSNSGFEYKELSQMISYKTVKTVYMAANKRAEKLKKKNLEQKYRFKNGKPNSRRTVPVNRMHCNN
jgi:hypothetical protein